MGEALEPIRNRVKIATKFGITLHDINQCLAQITFCGHRYNADSQKSIDSGY